MASGSTSRLWASPFEAEIRAFERATLLAPPPPGSVTFYGSSSIRLWSGLAEDFPQVTVVNRGYGGSTLSDCVRQLPRLIYPLKPGALVVYSGDNDLAEGRTPAQVVQLFQTLVDGVRQNLGLIPIGFISIKPAPCRWNNALNIRRCNELAERAALEFERVRFIDTMPALLGPDGRPRREYFQPDALHFSPAGYQILAAAIRDFLVRERVAGGLS